MAIIRLIDELGISSRVHIRNERVELTGQNPMFRNKYDIAMARAVAKDSVVGIIQLPPNIYIYLFSIHLPYQVLLICF